MDYSPVFNKLTRESLLKFVEMYDLEKKIKKGIIKEDLASSLIALFIEDHDVELKFQQFYLRTEEAGRKHIYLKSLKYTPDLKKHIHTIATEFLPESSRTFNPATDNEKVYVSSTDDYLLAKKIKISKAYHLIKNQEEDDKLTKVYSIKLIHFIEFVRFNFRNNTILYGYDAYGDYIDRKKIEESLDSLVKKFIGDSLLASLESFLSSDKIEKLRLLPNCIASSLSNRIRIDDKATFKKAKGDIDQILSDLKHEKYKITQIKEKNPNLDIQTHPLFEASLERSIENDLDLKNSGIELYYFTNKSGITTNFRIRIDIVRDLIITFSDSITREELYDVLTKLN